MGKVRWSNRRLTLVVPRPLTGRDAKEHHGVTIGKNAIYVPGSACLRGNESGSKGLAGIPDAEPVHGPGTIETEKGRQEKAQASCWILSSKTL